jgi:hypothetical protein
MVKKNKKNVNSFKNLSLSFYDNYTLNNKKQVLL